MRPHREIVIEFERVLLVRRRARTELRHCHSCGVDADMVSHIEAADLFQTEPAHLVDLITQYGCHYDVAADGTTYLCLTSLLERMDQQNNLRVLANGKN